MRQCQQLIYGEFMLDKEWTPRQSFTLLRELKSFDQARLAQLQYDLFHKEQKLSRLDQALEAKHSASSEAIKVFNAATVDSARRLELKFQGELKETPAQQDAHSQKLAAVSDRWYTATSDYQKLANKYPEKRAKIENQIKGIKRDIKAVRQKLGEIDLTKIYVALATSIR